MVCVELCPFASGLDAAAPCWVAAPPWSCWAKAGAHSAAVPRAAANASFVSVMVFSFIYPPWVGGKLRNASVLRLSPAQNTVPADVTGATTPRVGMTGANMGFLLPPFDPRASPQGALPPSTEYV